MKALDSTAKVLTSGNSEESRVLHLSPVFDSERTARALAGFLEEAKEILDRVEAGHRRAEEARPFEESRRQILRFLSEAPGPVEIHDLPRARGIEGRLGPRIVEELARKGLVSLERDETYPNIAYACITAAGRDEIRRVAVKEAMDWLHGHPGQVSLSVRRAREALQGLMEALGA